MGTDGGIRVPWLEVVEGKLHERNKTGPEVEWESDMNRSKSGNDVVFGGAHEAFSWISTVIVGGYMLDETGDGRRSKKVPKGRRGLVVRNKISDDVAQIFKETEDDPKGRDICFFLSVLLAVCVCITFIYRHQYVLHPIS